MNAHQECFTVFGDCFIREGHSDTPCPRRPISAGPISAIVIALFVGSCISLSAVAAVSTTHSKGHFFVNAQSMSLKQFGIGSFEDVLY
jgi:hypothetical protein